MEPKNWAKQKFHPKFNAELESLIRDNLIPQVVALAASRIPKNPRLQFNLRNPHG